MELQGMLGVVTGGGTGMGRAICEALASEGCSVALCDVDMEAAAETQRICRSISPTGTISTHSCDVSSEESVESFRDAVVKAHGDAGSINLLFNNAGIAGGGSFLGSIEDRTKWDKTFAVDWGGVYNCCRCFLPLLVASEQACVLNTSSVNGFWATVGAASMHTAYSAGAMLSDVSTCLPLATALIHHQCDLSRSCTVRHS
jgi:NAD(P)-dependent dehydrogenase (short-subunit alcohol dehydrogenase family)